MINKKDSRHRVADWIKHCPDALAFSVNFFAQKRQKRGSE
jgi:hypothetical protein